MFNDWLLFSHWKLEKGWKMDNWEQLSVPCTLDLKEIVRIGRVKRLPWMEGRFAYVWNGNLDSAGRIVLLVALW